MSVDPGFWRDRRVLVTGHNGFKGAWLSLWLQALGARVTGFGLPAAPTRPSLFEVARVGEGMAATVHGDVRSFDDVAGALRAARPEIVFHLAAQPMVRRSLVEPRATYEVNVLGTVNVLDAVRAGASPAVGGGGGRGADDGGSPLVVVATSDKCYANPGDRPRAFVEGDRLGGDDPYSSSKACAELICGAYARSFGLRLASARAGNVIGGGDWGEDRIVPDLLRSLEDGAPPLRVRYPQAVRPWQHVLNPLAGYIELAQALERAPDVACGAWNFGPASGDAHPVEDLLARIAELWPGGAIRWIADGEGQPPEAGHLALDSSRARERLGWRARWDLDAGLRALVDWHARHDAGEDMRAVSGAQIERYMEAQ